MSDLTTDLTTDRLVLRSWPADEVSAVVAGERRLPHWAEDFPADGDRVIAGFIAESPDALGPYGQRQIIERATGLVVGAVGLFPPADGTIEFGYGVVPSRRGRGYASEAAHAIAAFALTAPGIHTVRANVELSNPASARVLERAGLTRVSADAETAQFQATAPLPKPSPPSSQLRRREDRGDPGPGQAHELNGCSERRF